MSKFYDTLHSEGLISDESLDKIRQNDIPPLFSVHWELKTLLYLGVLMLTTGLGLLVYENIDTLGHQAVLALIGLLCAGSFIYCFKTSFPFSREKVKEPNVAFDYVLLLGCLSFVTFIGYLQFAYKTFGTDYGLATLIPMVVLFFAAYYFDHLGVLNMAIANLAIWMGVSVTPKALLLNNDFDSERIIYTYLVLAALLLVLAYASVHFKLKKHFKFSYQHYGAHVLFITLLAGYFHYYSSIICSVWMLLLFVSAWFLYRDAFKEKSFYFLLLVILYGYIAVSSLVTRLFILGESTGAFSLLLMYFIASATGLIFLLIHLNKILKKA